MSKLIITSHNRTFTVFDLESRQREFIKRKIKALDSPYLSNSGRATFRPFGIDADSNRIYIASNDKIAVFDKSTFRFISLLKVPAFLNTHQILKSDNVLYVTNAANDSIGIFNLSTQKNKFLDVKSFDIVTEVEHPVNANDLDTCHVNSLCLHENKIYFCLHNLAKPPSGYYQYDPETEKTTHVVSAGRCSHGVIIMGPFLYTLSTATGELLQIHLKTKNIRAWKIADPSIEFLRGLRMYKNTLLIGCLRNYKSTNTELIHAYVSQFTPETGQNERFITLEKSGIINDIYVLDTPFDTSS